MRVLSALIYLIFIIIVSSTISLATPQEDEFVKHFGNNPNQTKTWPEMKAYYDEPEKVKLEKLVTGALKKISKDWEHVYFDIQEPVFKKGTLKFKSSYQPMRLEILGFTVHFKQISKQTLKKLNVNNDDRWFMTTGLRKDCVYLLQWLHPGTDQWEFMLDQHLCGMRVKF